MTSEKERLRESQKYGVSLASSEGQERIEKPHITSTGKEGKLLRKKLAIALGLRPSSSTSTTSQSEGEDVQNVVEVFRKQVRKTVDSRSRNFPRTIQEREQENPDKSSLVIRKTVRKTTDISGEFLEEDFEDFDDIDRQETVSQKRSKEQHSMTAEKLEAFDHHERRSHRDATRENTKHKMIRKTTDVENINEFLNEDINEEERVSRKTKKIQDNSRMREMTDKKSGKRLYSHTKLENEDKSHGEIVLKTESWELKTKNGKQNESIIASASEEHDSYTGSNVATNVVPSEEIFSSYGAQSKKAPSTREIEEFSPRESVKLLREKIRKNARARPVRRNSRVDRDLEEKSLDNQNQEKIASSSEVKSTSELQESFSVAPDKDYFYDDQVPSNIPIPISKRKPLDMLDLKTKFVQKSKIPRRKSQTTKDEMGAHGARLKFDDFEGQIVDVQSVNSIQSIDDKLSKKISKKEDVEREKVLQQNPWQKRDSNTSLSQLLRKVSKKTDSTPFATTKETTSINTNNTSTNNNNITNTSQTSHISDTTIVSSRHNTSTVKHFDFDSFEAELSKLKASVFKTYEEFKDIRSMALGVEEELNDLKSTYGVSYFCMYGNQ